MRTRKPPTWRYQVGDILVLIANPDHLTKRIILGHIQYKNIDYYVLGSDSLAPYCTERRTVEQVWKKYRGKLMTA